MEVSGNDMFPLSPFLRRCLVNSWWLAFALLSLSLCLEALLTSLDIDTLEIKLIKILNLELWMCCSIVTPQDSSLHYFLSQSVTVYSTRAVTLVISDTLIVHLLTYLLIVVMQD